MPNLSAGISAIRAATVALETTGQNIANADNPNYHRQQIHLHARPGLDRWGNLVGAGVEVANITQARTHAIELHLTANTSSLASSEVRSTVTRRIEQLLAPSSGSLAEKTSEFFQSIDSLAIDPGNNAIRRELIQRAQSLIDAANEFQDGVRQISNDLNAQVQQAVSQFNDLAKNLANVQAQIAEAEGLGQTPNDLYDQRTQLTNEIATLVDARADHQGHNEVLLFASGAGLIGQTPIELQASYTSQGGIIVTQGDPNRPLPIADGAIAGILDSFNEIIPSIQTDVAAFVNSLVREIDQIHGQGIGTAGSFRTVAGVRGVSDVSVPLANADTAFPIEAGELFISVTDQTTGLRTVEAVAIDPATDSLQDLATAISAISNVQAVVDTQTGTLQVIAEPGYEFDFTPRLPSQVDTAAITGATVPTLNGQYTGASNENYSFTFLGSGTVGVTDGLLVEVRNNSGNLVTTLDVGQGYQAGSPLNVGFGVNVSFTADTANAGDTFSSRLISNSDTSGVLSALGLNSFFKGDADHGFGVNDNLQTNPELLATSFTGAASDNLNIQRLIDLKTQNLNEVGGKTLENYLADVVSSAGQQSRDYSQIRNNVELLNQQLQNDRAAVSGVDPNEELVKMIQFQRSFQAAARYISAIDESLVELFNIIR